MPATLELRIGDRTLDDFEKITVQQSIETVAWSIEIVTAPAVARTIPLGSRFELYAYPRTPNENLVVRGWIDKAGGSFGDERTSANLKGRTRSSLLVDCSALHDPGEWIDVDVLELARDLAEPYDVGVFHDAEDLHRHGTFPRFDKFALEEGESPWEAIERALRRIGALAFPRPGGIVIARPGFGVLTAAGEGAAYVTEDAAYVTEGVNVKGARHEHDLSGRFARYQVRGQSRGTSLRSGDAAIENEGTASDPAVRLDRITGPGAGPLRRRIIVADGSLAPGEAQRRAEYEASIAAARALTVSAEVYSWRARPDLERSGLWRPNFRVPVQLPTLGVDEFMLISAVQLVADKNAGMTAALTLRRPDAFVAEPEVDSDSGAPALDFASDDVLEDDLLS